MLSSLKFTCLVLLLGISSLAHSSVVFGLELTINGSTPTGSPPFLIATFVNTAVDTVRLTLVNTMPQPNFVDNWVFNMHPFVPITATWVSGPAGEVIHGFNFENGGSNMKAGLFDLMFHYPTASSDPNKFCGGLTAVYDLVGMALSENSFAVLSDADGPNPGGYYTAAHVQGFASGDGSGSIGTRTLVPEPASLLALGLGLLPMLRRRLRE